MDAPAAIFLSAFPNTQAHKHAADIAAAIPIFFDGLSLFIYFLNLSFSSIFYLISEAWLYSFSFSYLFLSS